MSEHDETYQENISALLDGELSEQKARALRACIEAGEEPRAVFQAFSAIEDAMPGAFPEVPAGLHEHILSGVRQAASRQTPRETNTTRQTGRRLLPRRLQTALIAAACLVIVITGAAALSGRLFRMGRSGAAVDTESQTLSGSAQAADAGRAYITHEGAAPNDAGEEETAVEGPTADAPEAGAGAAFDTTAEEDIRDRLVGFVSFTVLAGGETYEGEDAAAVVDDFFAAGPSDGILTLTAVFPDGDSYSVQLWYRGEKAVCSFNEDGIEVRSLDDLLAYFRV